MCAALDTARAMSTMSVRMYVPPEQDTSKVNCPLACRKVE